jgi:hypothetical protein
MQIIYMYCLLEFVRCVISYARRRGYVPAGLVPGMYRCIHVQICKHLRAHSHTHTHTHTQTHTHTYTRKHTHTHTHTQRERERVCVCVQVTSLTFFEEAHPGLKHFHFALDHEPMSLT